MAAGPAPCAGEAAVEDTALQIPAEGGLREGGRLDACGLIQNRASDAGEISRFESAIFLVGSVLRK